jgi:hypothetical protein
LTLRLTRATLAGRDLGQHLEFGFALDVEAQHVGLQRAAHVLAGLADAGKHDLRRVGAGGQDALELTR